MRGELDKGCIPSSSRRQMSQLGGSTIGGGRERYQARNNTKKCFLRAKFRRSQFGEEAMWLRRVDCVAAFCGLYKWAKKELTLKDETQTAGKVGVSGKKHKGKQVICGKN